MLLKCERQRDRGICVGVSVSGARATTSYFFATSDLIINYLVGRAFFFVGGSDLDMNPAREMPHVVVEATAVPARLCLAVLSSRRAVLDRESAAACVALLTVKVARDQKLRTQGPR